MSVVHLLKCSTFSRKVLVQKQPFRGVLRKRCSENMQQIYRRTPMPKCDFNKKLLLLLLETDWFHPEKKKQSEQSRKED